MLDNFVDIVGYQLEKVHTGVIAWLLDDERSPLPLIERVQLVQKLAPSLFQQKINVGQISAFQEFSFGRRLRIDLVLELHLEGDAKSYILIECKTDSEVRTEQLQQSEAAFKQRYPNVPYFIIVLAVGAGQFTVTGQLQEIQKLGYQSIDLTAAINLFTGLSIIGKNKIYDDWIAALSAERYRSSQVENVLGSAANCWDPNLSKSGYRYGFPLFYMFYDKIRIQLEMGPYKDWDIYSGSNNPVMNWKHGWTPVGANQNSIKLYWEFNWASFCLKAEIKNKTQVWVNNVRPALVQLCSSCPIKGRKTVNKTGTWVTAYKWDFDFCTQTPTIIASEITKILSHLHDKLKSVCP
ncbi:MAG: PD-(D/E)XK nuclease family protein [Desulfomonilaceae bacterium]